MFSGHCPVEGGRFNQLNTFWGDFGRCVDIILKLEKLAGLWPANFLAPMVGWWPSATWRALWGLFSFRCLGGPLPIILFRVGYPIPNFRMIQ